MKIAVLGTGSMGITHAKAYKSFGDLGEVTIVGRNENKTSDLAKQIGIKGTINVSSIMNDKSIEAVDVCMPTILHKEFVISALENNKHVFCEIPISYTLEDAIQMIEKAKEQNKIFQVAQLMRSQAEMAYVLQKVSSGDIGKIISIHIHRYQPYKVSEPIIELMGFDLDIVSNILGKPLEIHAIKSNRKDSEEYVVMLEYPDLSCLVEFKTITTKEFPLSHGVRIIGTKGLVEANIVFTGQNSYSPESSVIYYPKDGKKEVIEITGKNPYELECRYFVDTILGKVDGKLLDSNHAVDTLKIALSIKESLGI
jgi:predicted dehydrogenase